MDCKRKTSVIWNFFSVTNETHATCNLCSQTLSFKSSITNLKQHLSRRHPTINISARHATQSSGNSSKCINVRANPSTTGTQENIVVDGDQQASDNLSLTALNTSSASTPVLEMPAKRSRLIQDTLPVRKKINNVQKRRIDDKLLEMITTDFQPFSVVSDEGFRRFTEALNPDYTLPSRQFLSGTLLPAKYIEVQNRARELLKDAHSITLTTDAWTSCANDSYLALTAHFIDSSFKIKSVLLEVCSLNDHHTSANLAAEIKRIITEWDIRENKILLAIADNAANIKKTVQEHLKLRYLGCFAHTLNLIAQDSIKPLEPLILKVKDIVAYFRRSAVAKSKLDAYQRQNNQIPKKLIQAVSTRWNSVYYMCERLLELKEQVRASLAALGKEDLAVLSNEDFDTLSQLLKILAPLEMATRAISGEAYVTLSSVIIINNCLQSSYASLKKQSFSNSLIAVLNGIITGLNERFKNLESSNTLLVSTFLDPRYKNVGFSNNQVGVEVNNKVTNLLAHYIEQHQELETGNLQQQQQETPEVNQLWEHFDRKAATFQPSGTFKSRAIIELQRYVEEPLLARNSDPLKWWKSQAYNYPNLSQIVLEKFGTVATSVPCERIFSKAGQLISDRRSRMTSDKVKQIMFLNQNLKL